MERYSFIFLSLYTLTILAGLMPIGSSTAIETLWNNAHDLKNDENYHADLLKAKNVQNDTKYLLFNENPVKNTTQIREHAKNLLYLKKTSDASIISTGNFSNDYIKNTQHNGDREDDVDHEEGSSIGLSSHDILLDPSLIPARLSRQTKKGDYPNLTSIENISSNVKFNNYDESRNVPSKRSTNFEDDLSVAEDRYQPSYPYRYPYRGQFPNQRYRANDRRPYRNYWRYPVFPGK